MSAVEVLLALLEHKSAGADVDQVEALLEPENLLTVLRAEGLSDEDVRGQLAASATPGTLLLDLFNKGRTAAELMARLPPDTLERLAARNAKQDAAKRSERLAPDRGYRQPPTKALAEGEPPMAVKAGIFAIASGLIPVILALKIPALLLALVVAGPAVVFGAAAVAGAIGGWLVGAGRPARPLWALVGVASTPGGIAAAAVYGRYILRETERESMFTMELVAAYGVGLLPACVGWLLLRVTMKG